MKPTEIKKIIESRDTQRIKELISKGVLAVVDGKITYQDPSFAKDQEDEWDALQHEKKILLNSAYGALLNQGCRCFDKRIGQSTTLSGRQVVKHMSEKVNEIITGESDYRGTAVVYNDSVIGSTLINTNQGLITIQDLFDKCSPINLANPKEYANSDEIKVLGYDTTSCTSMYYNFKYVMRHLTSKELYRVVLANGKEVTVTADHSIMVLRDNSLQQMKPEQLLESDKFICSDIESHIEYTAVQSVNSIGVVDDYVYDISVNDDNPYFFGNDILLHNTDSVIGSTTQHTNRGDVSIEQLFTDCPEYEVDESTGKEYGYDPDLMVMSYDPIADEPYLGHINYIYRHKVSKGMYEVEDIHGNKVTITEDHSIMVERYGKLLEVKPSEILESDIMISLIVKDNNNDIQ